MPHSTGLALGLSVLALLSTGCSLGDSAATPTPARGFRVATPLPRPSAVSEAPGAAAPTALVQPATQAPAPTALPSETPFQAVDLGVTPEPGCEIPREPEQIILMPVWDAPEEAHAAWGALEAPTLVAEVTQHDAEQRFYRLRAIEPEADHDFVVSYGGEPLPLEDGQTYRFSAHRDPPGALPAGTGLRIEDDAGLVFLGISERETEGAAARIFGGDRAGFTVSQPPTTCLHVQLHPCGFELRAGPVSFRRGDAAATVLADETAELEGDPAYDATVFTSHHRRWLGTTDCDDPTDWVLSYRIARR